MLMGHQFLADLIQFDLSEFDVILEMDWLVKHKALIDCSHQKVVLREPKGKRVSYIGLHSLPKVQIISSLKAQKFLQKGCEGYLFSEDHNQASETQLTNIPVASEYTDFFLMKSLTCFLLKNWIAILSSFREPHPFLSHLTVWPQRN